MSNQPSSPIPPAVKLEQQPPSYQSYQQAYPQQVVPPQQTYQPYNGQSYQSSPPPYNPPHQYNMSNVSHCDDHHGEKDVLPSMLFFFFGWIFCFIWFGGLFYWKSRHPTARVFARMCLVMIVVVSTAIIIASTTA
eukprot:TRINITY_DN2210_c0_g1_i2.p1 TRINITY_DN2210_c0_g1~~TRINITY_DN2210_c0_g1_i2.p1  ORF type:complete len:135 (+),score=23.89 TRINITY_DN2210_c0_g1_i2:64-468(+)